MVFDLYGVGVAAYVEKVHLLYMGISCSFLEDIFIIGLSRIELLGMTVHFELHGIIGSRIVSVDTTYQLCTSSADYRDKYMYLCEVLDLFESRFSI